MNQQLFQGKIITTEVVPSTEIPAEDGVSIINIDPSLVVAGSSLAVSLAGAWIWKHHIVPKLSSMRHSFRRTLENDMKIQSRMYILIDKFKASRVLLYQAHNGSTYSSGQHQWKVSITHEALANGVSSVKHWSQSKPAIEFLKNYPELINLKVVYLNTSDNTMEALTQLKHRYVNNGVYSTLCAVVKGYKEEEIIGFLSIHWNDANYKIEGLENTEEFKTELSKIEGLLLNNDGNPFLAGIDRLLKR